MDIRISTFKGPFMLVFDNSKGQFATQVSVFYTIYICDWSGAL
jgi:hypothetical protein